MDDATWDRVRGAHLGFQAGVDIMAVLPSIAEATGFYDLRVNPDLTVHIPERLNDPELQAAMAKVLVPPPVAKSDEILAESGGMFYARETPEHDVYVKEGDHFECWRSPVHHRGHEDVQQVLRTVLGDYRKGAG